MVTAIHDISVAIDSMRRGAYDYLLKPFEREHLVATVQRALDHRQALQESHTYQQNLEQVVRARTEMLRQAMEDLEHSYDVTLEALGDALDLKDSETEGHSKRVTAYTIALARAMGISPAQIQDHRPRGISPRHRQDGHTRRDSAQTRQTDPGRNGLYARSLLRGATNIFRKIPFLSEAAEIVFTRIRSTLTAAVIPATASGNKIPIGARIFAVADALDAITSDRPVSAKRAPSTRHAKRFCAAPARQFDPGVVEVYLKIPNELWNELRAEITNQNIRFSTFDIANPAAAQAS
jgi:response regulator RpfG family c-di-GMP phosphodiesterase